METSKKAVYTFWIRKELLAFIRKQAKKEDTTASKIINNSLAKYMDDVK